MKFVGESEAKAIVKRDLKNWNGTWSEFCRAQYSLFAGVKGVTSVEKREKMIRKKFKKYEKSIYFKEVKAEFSHDIAVVSLSKTSNEDINKSLSKSKQKASNRAQQKLNQHSQKIKNNKIHVFIVKNDVVSLIDELLIIIYSTRGENKDDLLRSHSVATIKKHCLERIVQRLNLANIYDAIDEVLGSIVWLEGSGSELAGRPAGSYGDDGVKRHIPTPNGALLLKTSSIENSKDKPTQDCALITWIHKNQFKIGQEVTKRDFIFVQMINYFLSDPKVKERIHEYKEIVENFVSAEGVAKVVVKIYGEEYPANKFISTLENGVYLDFIIDFEKAPE